MLHAIGALAGRGALAGAVFNLNHPAHVVKWHFIQLSLANVLVIAVMFLAFGLALVLPFPGARSRALARREEDPR
jgi:hypothetical protein